MNRPLLPGLLLFLKRKPMWLVLFLWAAFQVLWFTRFGFVFTLEATKYIEEAGHLVSSHQFSQTRYFFYATTIIIIAISTVVKAGLHGALFFIMGINLAAYLYLFLSLRRYFARTLPALLVVVLLVSFWPYQSWSMFLFTECLFYSLVLFLLGLLLRFQTLTLAFLLRCGLLLFLLTITRPLGVLFMPPVLLFVFFHLTRRQRWLFALAAIAFFVLLNLIVQVVFTTTSDWNMSRALTEDSIICDMPVASGNRQLDLSQHPNQFYQLAYYVTHNFGHFAGLALVRLRYFFTLVRTYYSTGHNLFLGAWLFFIYGSILVGVKQVVRGLRPALRLFFVSSILLFAATIALQCDDYHNRFFLTLMPFFTVCSVVALQPFIDRLFSFAKSRKG